jgi:hypothetical protein
VEAAARHDKKAKPASFFVEHIMELLYDNTKMQADKKTAADTKIINTIN